MTAPTAADRAQVIAGLRELADLLEANPGLPVSAYPDFLVHAGPVDMDIDDTDEDAKRSAVDAAAAILGLPTETRGGHHTVTWQSRGEEGYSPHRVEYRVVAITSAAMAEHELKASYSKNVQVTT